MKHFALFLLISALVTACYPMPTEDNYSILPMTNNPDVTKQRRESPIPQMPV
jgi:hypothetical protein